MLEHVVPVRMRSVEAGEQPARAGGAVVIGGDYRGLGIVRSLGRRGIPVWVLVDHHLLAGTSRYASRRLKWPAGGHDVQLVYLLDLAVRHQLEGWALFPTGDETAALIASHHATLSEKFRLTTPPWEVMCWAHDKRLSYRLAAEVSVDCPETHYPTSREEVAALEFEYPVILKPAVREGFNPLVHAKAWQVDDRRALLARYDEAVRLIAPDLIMVQGLIPGGGDTQYSYGALCLEGRPLASITARRIRQYPVDFGRSSSFVESIEQPEVEDAARRLLAAMRFTGLVEVEFKRDPRDGRYKLLDVNPRVWGWHSLGRRAGVDFPYLLWQMIQGDSVPELRAKPGVRWVRLTTDLLSLAGEIRRGRLSPIEYLRSLRGPLETAVFALDDPAPALAEVPLLSILSLKRGAV